MDDLAAIKLVSEMSLPHDPGCARILCPDKHACTCGAARQLKRVCNLAEFALSVSLLCTEYNNHDERHEMLDVRGAGAGILAVLRELR